MLFSDFTDVCVCNLSLPVIMSSIFYFYIRGKLSSIISCKTPDERVLQIKHQMLKLITGDTSLICKSDPRSGALILDLTKMHHLYLEEHEPQAYLSMTGRY